MAQHDFDLVAIGGGSAGLVTAAVAAGLGARAAIVEKARLGGECLWTGCVPSKALIHGARVAHLLRHSANLGLPASTASREALAGVLEYARSSRLRVQEADAVEPLLRDLGVQFFYGDARLRSPRELQLDGDVLRSRHFVLCTGSRPRIPPIPGLVDAGYLTNLTVFDLETPPESMVVIGGGPIGVELAQAFARLGTKVTLLQRALRILVRDDAELASLLEARLREEGIDLVTNAEVVQVRRTHGSREVTYRAEQTEHTVTASKILVAAGRAPNTEGLDLDQVGVQCGEQGVVVDRYLRTTVRNIWACGDVIGFPQFSHAAEYEAKLVVQNALLPLRGKANFERMPWATFTDPELAHVGLTEAAARERGVPMEVFRHPFGRDDRALVDDEGYGVVKLVARAGSGKLLGAQILGPRAGELIQQAVLALDRGLSVRHLADAVHVYPTLSVAVQRAAQYWWKARSDAPAVRQALRLYFQWSRRR